MAGSNGKGGAQHPEDGGSYVDGVYGALTQLRHARLDEAFGIRIAERVQQGGDRGGVLGGSGSDLDHVQARLWEKQRSVTVAAASAARWIALPGSHDQ